MTERLSAHQIERAASLLRDGALVAFPTETVYGLGGDATNDRTVAAIFEAKERPRFNPLIIHVPDEVTAQKLVCFDVRAVKLARLFWPGPLTLVLPRRPDCPISLLASAGLDSLAIRVPAHPLAQQLLRLTGKPIAAPSANRSGKLSPTSSAHVLAELDGRIAAVIEGGPCTVGIESTVLDLTSAQPILLRPGAMTAEMLSEILGPLGRPSAQDPLRSPGLLESHYAPSLPLRLDATNVHPDEALLAFGPNAPTGARETRWLSRSGDLVEAATNLFSQLRALDRLDFSGIAVTPIPNQGLGIAINDRLTRAAAPRPKSDIALAGMASTR